VNLIQILNEGRYLLCEVNADGAQLVIFANNSGGVKLTAELIDPIDEEFEVVQVLRHLMKLCDQVSD